MEKAFGCPYHTMSPLLHKVIVVHEGLFFFVFRYDFVNPNGVAVKASGYRGVLHMMSYILQPLLHSLQKAAKDRSSFRFPASEHINTLSVYCSALQVTDSQ